MEKVGINQHEPFSLLHIDIACGLQRNLQQEDPGAGEHEPAAERETEDGEREPRAKHETDEDVARPAEAHGLQEALLRTGRKGMGLKF